MPLSFSLNNMLSANVLSICLKLIEEFGKYLSNIAILLL